MPSQSSEDDSSPFWQVYDRHYARMGNVPPALDGAKSSPALPPTAGAWLPDDHAVPILDVGVGWGNLLLSLWAAGYRTLFGVDISRPMVEVAAQRLPKEISLACHDANAYVRQYSHCFELIIVFDVIEHMPRAKGLDLLRACYGALTATGRIAIRTPNMANILSGYCRHLDVTHECGYTEWSLCQLLDSAGFSAHRVFADGISGISPWRKQATLRHPLAGLNVERIASTALHRMLYRMHPYLPRPTTFDSNFVLVSSRSEQNQPGEPNRLSAPA